MHFIIGKFLFLFLSFLFSAFNIFSQGRSKPRISNMLSFGTNYTVIVNSEPLKFSNDERYCNKINFSDCNEHVSFESEGELGYQISINQRISFRSNWFFQFGLGYYRRNIVSTGIRDTVIKYHSGKPHYRDEYVYSSLDGKFSAGYSFKKVDISVSNNLVLYSRSFRTKIYIDESHYRSEFSGTMQSFPFYPSAAIAYPVKLSKYFQFHPQAEVQWLLRNNWAFLINLNFLREK